MGGLLLSFSSLESDWNVCLDGWSWEAFSKWKEFLSLGIPGMLMLCLEWWAFEIVSFLAGIMGTTELAAHSVIGLLIVFFFFLLATLISFLLQIVLTVCSITFFIPYGTSVAASILIGNYLGDQNAHAAKLSARTSIFFAIAIELISAILLITLRDYLPLIFTNVPEVIE